MENIGKTQDPPQQESREDRPPSRRLQLEPLEPRTAPNVGWGE